MTILVTHTLRANKSELTSLNAAAFTLHIALTTLELYIAPPTVFDELRSSKFAQLLILFN